MLFRSVNVAELVSDDDLSFCRNREGIGALDELTGAESLEGGEGRDDEKFVFAGRDEVRRARGRVGEGDEVADERGVGGGRGDKGGGAVR